MSDSARKKIVDEAAELAEASIDAAEYDVDGVEDWGGIGGSVFVMGSIEAAVGEYMVETEFGRMEFEGSDIGEPRLQVNYTADGVQLSSDASAEPDRRASTLTRMSAETAKQLGLILFRAGATLEIHREVGGKDDA